MSIEELRAFVLSLEGIEERSHHGKPDFRFQGKIVVNLDEGDQTITIKLPLEEQAALVARNDPAISLPGGWAKHGWTTISLHLADSDEIRELVTDAWEQSQPKRSNPSRSSNVGNYADPNPKFAERSRSETHDQVRRPKKTR
jgi:predicted DNA-binding protein (MmcQ/YjbR family)